MPFFVKKKQNLLAVEMLGLHFANPVGLMLPSDAPIKCPRRLQEAGFTCLTPPKDNVLEWVRNLQEIRKKTVLAVNLKTDIVRSFSLVYDFADLIVIDPDSDNGISSPDIADTAQLLDELVSLRLCYEHYTPIFLRLSHEDTPDEIHPLVSCARLSGLDGIVAPTAEKVRLTALECQSRMPIIGIAETPEDAVAELQAGATLVQTQLRPHAMNRFLKAIENQLTNTL
jgi:dihydroorotate dehydrogenase